MNHPPYDFADVVAELVARGFKLPLTFAAVDMAGSATIGAFTSAEAHENFVSWQHEIVAPFHVLVVDSYGNAARVAVGADGKREVAP